MNIEERTDEAVKFFGHLWSGKPKLAQAELHNRGRGNNFHEGKRRFRAFGMSLEIHLEEVMTKADQGVEMFYCPTPMGGDNGRKKYQVQSSCVAFSDADYGLSREAKARMIELGACLVRSGGKTDDGQPKYHIYLRLSRPVGLDELERINRGLKAFVNGDKFDATSLLRVPGTRNHKYPGKPLVRVERYADQTHDPELLADMFPVPKGVVSGVELEGLKLPEIPKDFNFNDRRYWKLKRLVIKWNQMFQEGNVSHRYNAATALVRDGIKTGAPVDVIYAFAEACDPLVDKQAEENGYNIRQDIAKTYYRETKAQSSGLTVEEFTREADQRPAVKERDRSTPSGTPDRPTSKPLHSNPATGMPNLGKSFPFRTPNLDELLAGDYQPLEPTLVPCGPFHLLYPGKSHGISSDRGLGKTNVTIAMVHQVMKQGGRVVYFDYEDSPDTFIRDRMMNQHGISEEMIRTQFLYFNGVEMIEAVELDMDGDDGESPTLSEAIIGLADAITSWDLVVIDGVTNAMSDWSIEKDTAGDKPGNFLDGNKAVDYLWWHRRHIKPFLDRGIATFQIDHTNKTGGNRVGGTGQKGAKFTGIEYELRAEKNGSLVMGGTGKLLLSVAKDRIGRVLRFKRKRPQEQDESDAFDVARFTMTSDINGHVTRASFDPIDQEIAGHDADGNIQGPALSDREKKALDIIQGHSGPLNKSGFAKKYGGQTKAAYALVDSLISKGLVDIQEEGASKYIVPIQGAPAPHEPGKAELDFSKADYIPARARSQRECRKCRDHHDYPAEFAQPDDIGYMPNRPMCKPCAADPIDSEPVDGPEWARGIRERISGRRRKRGDSQSS